MSSLVAVIITPEIMASVVEYRLSMLTMAKLRVPGDFSSFSAKRIGIPESAVVRKIVLSDAIYS